MLSVLTTISCAPSPVGTVPTTTAEAVSEPARISESTTTSTLINPEGATTTTLSQIDSQGSTSFAAALESLTRLQEVADTGNEYLIEGELCPLFPNIVPDIISYPPVELDRQRWGFTVVPESRIQEFDERATGPGLYFYCYDGSYLVATVNYFQYWEVRDLALTSPAILERHISPGGKPFPREPYYDFDFFGSVDGTWGEFAAVSDHLVFAARGINYEHIIDWLNTDWLGVIADLLTDQSIWIYMQKAEVSEQ